jgi:uncharacterized membrane protein (UPF0127 family)
MKLVNKKTNSVIVEHLKYADSFFKRLKGLMFTKDLNKNEGLLIKDCKSIHTFFMNYSLDAVFINNKFKIVKIIRNMKPRRVTPIYFGAAHVIEVKAGYLPADVSEGDFLEVVNV